MEPSRSVFIQILKVRSSKTQQFYLQYVKEATSFDLQSYHQAILDHIIIGILSGSAHIWGPKMFTLIKIVGINVTVAIKYVSK